MSALGGGLRPPSDRRRAPGGALLRASPQTPAGIARAKPALGRETRARSDARSQLLRAASKVGGDEAAPDADDFVAAGSATGGDAHDLGGGGGVDDGDPERRSRTVFEGWSEVTGRIRVVDYRRERRLICSGDILSVYPLDGDWAAVEGEYWWQALTMGGLPSRPRVLLVGLGGGTQVHLLARLTDPREMTVIERDPVIVQVACEWFGLREVSGLEFLCGDAEPIVRWLRRVGRRFDFVMEDAAYAAPPEEGLLLAEALAGLVARGGRLVVNRHRRGDGRAVAERLRPRFQAVSLRRVRRDGENVLVCCRGPRPGR